MSTFKDLKEPTMYRSDDFKSAADLSANGTDLKSNNALILNEKINALKSAFDDLSSAIKSCVIKPQRTDNLIDGQKPIEYKAETKQPSPFKPFEMKIE